jgi:glycosyltransferase involved in cell wall biosynthesis
MLMPSARQHRWFKKTVAWYAYQLNDLVNADAVHVTSEEELVMIRGVRRSCADSLIPLGVHVPTIESGPIRLKAPNEFRQLLFLGRLHPIKNLPVLLSSFAASDTRDWKLRIVGPDEGEHLRYLKMEISRLKLTDRVTIEDPIFGEDKEQLFSSIDALVLPSHSENYGAVVAEALAYGRPVIASTGTPWSVLESQRCGWWVAPTVAGLTRAISELANTDVAELAAMGSRGRAFVSSNLTWKTVGARMAALYDAVA